MNIDQLADENSRLRTALLKQDKSTNRPSEDMLRKLLGELGTNVAVARVYGVDEKSIRNWRKLYEITTIKEDVKEFIKALRYEKYDIKTKLKANPTGETLIISLGDWHAGKEIKDEKGKTIFNEEILKHRIKDRLFPEILSLLDTRIKKATKITEVVILLIGDMADGSNIYPTQQYNQYIAPPRQVELCQGLIMALVESLVDRGLPVAIYAVRGNHGKGLKLESPENNWDTMLYLWLRREIQKFPKVTLEFSDLDYMNFKIRGWNYHIRHIAPEQDDTAAGRAKFLGWENIHSYDGIVYGHYHHFGITDFYGARRFRNGCVTGWDDLSEKMAKTADPVQLIWGCSNNRVLSFLYPVDLKGNE